MVITRALDRQKLQDEGLQADPFPNDDNPHVRDKARSMVNVTAQLMNAVVLGFVAMALPISASKF